MKRITEILKENNIKYMDFSYIGEPNGDSTGFPQIVGSKLNQKKRIIDIFTIGLNVVNNWEKIYEYNKYEDFEKQTFYRQIYVEHKNIDDVIKILKNERPDIILLLKIKNGDENNGKV